MNLPTEIERQKAFKREYGEQSVMFTPNAGINKSGFALVTFDPETKYAQFAERGKIHHGQIIEYVTNAKGDIINRERYYQRYLNGEIILISGKINYYLENKNYNWVQWEFHYDFKKKILTSCPTLNIYSDATDERILLAVCFYHNQSSIASRIDVTSGNLKRARTSKDNPPLDKRFFVPSPIEIKMNENGEGKYLVYSPRVDPEELLNLYHSNIISRNVTSSNLIVTDKNLPGDLFLILSDTGITVIRENDFDRHELKLVAPKINVEDLDKRLRENWEEFVIIPQKYPVVFDF